MTTRRSARPTWTSGPRAQPTTSNASMESAVFFIFRLFSNDAGARGRRGLPPIERQVDEAFVAQELVDGVADLADDHAEDVRVGDERDRLLARLAGGVGELREQVILGEADEARHQAPLEGGAE